ncbi:YrhC family protein [Aquibacillus saliphilus]|uniref:YrhC family protein n=1 Tax=Aquibacillus saliphilus TaxID=1909422 RepID=UPI001CF010A7|nr:YrhC family protein [Aquibacillus saliphilus]
MDLETMKIKNKIEDYSRFLVTLLILSIYFYLGMIINVFLSPTGKESILIGLLLVSLSISGWFALLLRKWQIQLNEQLEH